MPTSAAQPRRASAKAKTRSRFVPNGSNPKRRALEPRLGPIDFGVNLFATRSVNPETIVMFWMSAASVLGVVAPLIGPEVGH